MNDNNLVAQVIRRPEIITELSISEWELLINQCRSSLLLAKVACLVDAYNLFDKIPEQIKKHLQSIHVVAEHQVRVVRWDVKQIQKALEHNHIHFILLKGAAYVMAELPVAEGRVFSDIDIMVPRVKLDQAEKQLFLHGWVATPHDKYDQEYYRKWMHELPPLQHVKRGTTLDVHHAILPLTSRLNVDPEKLQTSARALNDDNYMRVLAPVDMVLHSATHLFHDGELEHGLRDLVDLDSLLRHFSEKEDGFWNDMIERAQEMDLVRPMYYAFRFTHKLLGTPVPEDVLTKANIGKPNFVMSWIMDGLFSLALAPDHPSCDRPLTGLARWLLYIRSHYLRMPLHLLIPHLLRKAFKKESTD